MERRWAGLKSVWLLLGWVLILTGCPLAVSVKDISLPVDSSLPTLSISDSAIVEGGTLAFAVSLSKPSSDPVSFQFQTFDGITASSRARVSDSDYTNNSGNETIASGDIVKWIYVDSISDPTYEVDESLVVSLSSLVGANPLDIVAIGTIQNNDAMPTISANDLSVIEGATTQMTWTLSALSGAPVEFQYATRNGVDANPLYNAIATQDFVAITTAAATIPAGSLSTSIQITTIHDITLEANELFSVTVTALTGASLLTANPTVEILDDDSNINLYIDDVVVSEGGTLLFLVSLDNVSVFDVTFNYQTVDVTAESPADYTAIAARTGTIPAGNLTLPISVITTQETLFEFDETFLISLSNAINTNIADNLGIGTITNDDTSPTIFISDATTIEGQSLAFLITLSQAAGAPVSFDFNSYDDTALNSLDYAAISGRMTISSGLAAVTLMLATVADSIDENNENLILSLSGLTDLSAGDLSAAGELVDNNAAPLLYVSDHSLNESNTLAYVVVSLNTASGLPVTFDFETNPSSAESPADFISQSGTATLTPGARTIAVLVPLVNDALDEFDETFHFNISNPSQAGLIDPTGVQTIIDEDPFPQMTIFDTSLIEGETAQFTVSLSTASGRNISFDWRTHHLPSPAFGQAKTVYVADYGALTVTGVTIGMGSTQITIAVPTNSDNMNEPDETFTVSLTAATYATISDAAGVATITNDDPEPDVNWSVAFQSVTEGQSILGPKRIRLNFNNSTRPTPLINFPVMVVLNSSRINYAETQDQGQDIRFVDADGTTILPHQIESWNESGNSYVWVRVPQIDASSTTDHIWLYYGNTAAADTQNAKAVWDDDYIAIWHLNDFNDSSDDGNHGQSVGTVTISGQAGLARSFDGVDDMIYFPQPIQMPLGLAARTACGLARPSSTSGTWKGVFSTGRGTTASSFHISRNAASGAGGSWGGDATSASFWSAGVWAYICVTYDGTTNRLYRNGTQTATLVTASSLVSGPSYIGRREGDYNAGYTGFYWDGLIDEVRISKVARSADWISAESASVFDTLITYTPAEVANAVVATAQLTELSGYGITIPFIVGGTATTGADHNLASSAMTIGIEASTTASITLSVFNDQYFEPDENLTISISNPVRAISVNPSVHEIQIVEASTFPMVNISSTTVKTPESTWWNNSWLSRRELKVDGSQLGADLSSFPLMVRLDSTRIDYSKVQNSGQDLRFVAADGVTELPYEIEKWDELGTSIVWVKAAKLRSGQFDNVIWMYYENAAAPAGSNGKSVWDKSYRAVHHMSAYSDASPFNIDGTNTGATAIPGIVGDGQLFDSSDVIDLLLLGPLPKWTEPRSVCSWFRTTIGASSWAGVQWGTAATGEEFMIGGAASNRVAATIVGTDLLSPGFYQSGQWQYVCLTADTTRLQLYVNGVEVETRATPTSFNTRLTTATIGRRAGVTWPGEIDEIRISKEVRSQHWIRSEYLSMTDALINYGPEIPLGTQPERSFDLTLSNRSYLDAVIPWTVSGTSTPGADHTLQSGEVTIMAGQISANIAFDILDDATSEGLESITIAIGTPTNAFPGTEIEHEILIEDDDVEPSIGFAIAGSTIDESIASVAITLALNRVHNVDVTVNYSASGLVSANQDTPLTSLSGSVTIPQGQLFTSIVVPIIDDPNDEWDEDLILSLSAPTNATLNGDNQYTLFIIDNDPFPTLTISDATVVEGGSLTFVVSYSEASGRLTYWNWQTLQNTAISDSYIRDYTAVPTSSLTIGAHLPAVTLAVNSVQDIYDEFDEFFTVSLTQPTYSYVTFGNITATGTIVDEEPTPTVQFSAALEGVPEQGSPWWNPNWPRRVRLTFNHRDLPSDLNNFPLLVRLNNSRVNYAQTQNSGQDLRFLDQDGSTELKYKIEKWDESGESLVWVTVPKIDASSINDHIWLYYGNPSAPSGQSQFSIFDSNYRLVMHLNNNLNDSSENVLSGSNYFTQAATGYIGGARRFVRSSQSRVEFMDSPEFTLSGSHTFEMWIRPTSGHTDGVIISKDNNSYLWRVADSGTGVNSFSTALNTPSPGWSWVNIGGSVGTNQWRHVALVYDQVGGFARVYVDGLESANTPVTGAVGSSLANFVLGARSNTGTYSSWFDGLIDEFRVSGVRRSDEWIRASYLSQSDQYISYTTQSLGFVLSGPSEKPVFAGFSVAGTATVPDDYTVTPGVVTFTLRSTYAPIPISVIDDSLAEADETAIFEITISNYADLGAISIHTMTITDDDSYPEMRVSDASITEGSSAVLFVSLSAAYGSEITVDWAITDGSAVSPADFTAASGVLTFAPGDTNKSIAFTSTDDSLDEYNEVAQLVLSNPSLAKVVDAVGEITLVDDDAQVQVGFALASSTAPEATSNHVVAVSLSAISGKVVQVPYSVGGLATSGSDYNRNNGTVIFNVGQTSKNIPVTIINDTTVDPNETVTLSLGTATNADLTAIANHTITIVDNEAAPTLIVGDSSGTEGTTISHMIYNSSFASVTAPVYFSFTTYNGSAVAGADFAALTLTGTIPVGSYYGIASVTTLDDTLFEGVENLAISIVPISPGWALLDGTATLSIVDNDPMPTVSLAATSSLIDEGVGSFNVEVSLSHLSYQAITVSLAPITGTASTPADFTSNGTILTIPAGSPSGSFSFTVVDDALIEAPETIIVSIGSVTNANALLSRTHTATIGDNEAGAVRLFVTDSSVTEGGTLLFSVSLDGTSGTPTVFTLSSINQSATAGSDFAALNATRTIPAGQQVVNLAVVTNQDVSPEIDETFLVSLSGYSGTPTVVDPIGVGTIINDEYYPALSLSPNVATAAANQPISFSAAGGVGPYAYSITSGAGTISNLGLYTGPSAITIASLATVQVSDSIGNMAAATVSLVPNWMCRQATAWTPSGTLFDSGGPSANYFNNENCNFVIDYRNLGTLTIAFQSFVTESGYERIRIYDQNDIQVGSWTGSTSPGTVTLPGGYARVNWYSDVSVVYSGFQFTWATGATTLPALALTPSAVSIAPGATTSFFASNGVEPYTFSIDSGPGTITATMATQFTFRADSPAPSTVKVVDALGSVALANVAVTMAPMTAFGSNFVRTFGGITMTFNGSGFIGNLTVTAGGSDCGSVSIVSSSQIRCMSPPTTPGPKDVVINRYDGSSVTIVGGMTGLVGAWQTMPAPPINELRASTATVWTGKHLIIWGGQDWSTALPKDNGAVYDAVTDSWSMMSSAPLDARLNPAAVWSGREVIIYGGHTSSEIFNDGATYDPVTNTWTTIPLSTMVARQIAHNHIWTGKELIIWGGRDLTAVFSTGAAYNPRTNSWRDIATAPAALWRHSTVWTGSRMIVHGGMSATTGSTYSTATYSYDPETNAWATLASAPTFAKMLDDGANFTAWTGKDMFSGYATMSGAGSTYARYTEDNNTWTALPNPQSPLSECTSSVYRHMGYVWTGKYMVRVCSNSVLAYDLENNRWQIGSYGTQYFGHTKPIWTGQSIISCLGRGSTQCERFVFEDTDDPFVNLSSNTWGAITVASAPTARTGHSAVWTGRRLVVWGGHDGVSEVNTGAAFDPITNSWSAISTTGAPTARQLHTAIWTGRQMLIWGGQASGSAVSTGARYNPVTDTWSSMSATGQPLARFNHSAVWSGSRMVIWGGSTDSTYERSGGLYNPANDTWTATSETGAVPSARAEHRAVFNGRQMIVWGGSNGSALGDGAIYDPNSNNWSTLSSTGAPSARSRHAMAIVQKYILVWGGNDGSNAVNDGARYNMSNGTWSSITSTDAPSARQDFSYVSTDQSLLVWGGQSAGSPLGDGAQYNPISNSWAALSGTDAPDARFGATAVWTGYVGDGLGRGSNHFRLNMNGDRGRMILWGGDNGTIKLDSGAIFNPAQP